MIKIFLNKELDYRTYENFCDFTVAGADFSAKIKKDHPEINLENHREYIDSFYSKNQKVLEKSCEEINELILQKETGFFQAVYKLFETDYSKTDYKGYLSIFDCNPRFIEDKTFQIFYRKNLSDKLEVIFHEILHFIFFDYCDKNFSAETKNLDKNSSKLWELSEIFNVIVLNLPEFQNILRKEEKLFYPNLSEKLEASKKIWTENNGNVFTFIKKYLK